MSESFSIENVREHKGTDGKFRYLYGQFSSYNQAKEERKKLIKMGYPDSFIMNIERYKE
jgi:hypothetical protein